MGKFSQKLGQKLKAGASLGMKVGAVAGGIGMAYLGMKGDTKPKVDEAEVARQMRKAEIEGMMDDYNKQHGTNLGQPKPKNKSYRRERGLPERTKTP